MYIYVIFIYLKHTHTQIHKTLDCYKISYFLKAFFKLVYFNEKNDQLKTSLIL